MEPDDMMGSSAARAASSPVMQERLADLVAHLRTWAAAAASAAAEIDSAEVRHAQRLGARR